MSLVLVAIVMFCSAAFLPFLKKQPVPAAKPAKDQEEEDPLALPLPQTKTSSQLGTANSKFISKLNGKSAAAKPGASHAAGRTTLTPSKSSSTPGTTKLGAAAGFGAAHRTVAASKSLAGKAVPGKPVAGKGPAVGKPVPLTPAQAKAEAEKRRLKQLERLAALGALAPKDAPPELLAKYEQAKQQIAEIKRQQELEAKRKAADEQRRRQLEQRRQQQEQERQRLLQEKERMRTGKAGSAAARPSTPPAAAAAAGPGRGPSLAFGAGKPTSAGSKATGPSSQTAAGSFRVPAGSSNQRQQQQQQQKDPYAHLNPRVSKAPAWHCCSQSGACKHQHPTAVCTITTSRYTHQQASPCICCCSNVPSCLLAKENVKGV